MPLKVNQRSSAAGRRNRRLTPQNNLFKEVEVSIFDFPVVDP